jgi:hypothetical protein
MKTFQAMQTGLTGLKVLVLVVAAVVVSGCATYHSALRTTDSEFRDIVRDNNMRVYVEHAELEDCIVAVFRRKEDKCVKINTSTMLIPALKSEGIKVVDNKENANVIVKLIYLIAGRGWDYFPTTAKFNINNNVIKIIAKPYYHGRILDFASKRDWDAGVKTVEMAITRLLDRNNICNNCTIEAKTSFSNGDGIRILTYRDNIGF